MVASYSIDIKVKWYIRQSMDEKVKSSWYSLVKFAKKKIFRQES